MNSRLKRAKSGADDVDSVEKESEASEGEPVDPLEKATQWVKRHTCDHKNAFAPIEKAPGVVYVWVVVKHWHEERLYDVTIESVHSTKKGAIVEALKAYFGSRLDTPFLATIGRSRPKFWHDKDTPIEDYITTFGDMLCCEECFNYPKPQNRDMDHYLVTQRALNL